MDSGAPRCGWWAVSVVAPVVLLLHGNRLAINIMCVLICIVPLYQHILTSAVVSFMNVYFMLMSLFSAWAFAMICQICFSAWPLHCYCLAAHSIGYLITSFRFLIVEMYTLVVGLLLFVVGRTGLINSEASRPIDCGSP